MRVTHSLPFPRGQTFSYGESDLLDANGVLGQEYEGLLVVAHDVDEAPGKARPLILRIVRNETGGDIDLSSKSVSPWYKFAATGGTFGCQVAGAVSADGDVAKPVDPKHLGKTIQQHDLFYVVEQGVIDAEKWVDATLDDSIAAGSLLAIRNGSTADGAGAVSADTQAAVAVAVSAASDGATSVKVEVLGGSAH